MASSLFSELKWAGVNCELVTEYTKDKVWEESFKVLDSQIYILGKQYHRIQRVSDKVDVVITDSSLLLTPLYNKDYGETLDKLAIELYHRFQNLNFLLTRKKDYNPVGRMETEEEAKLLDRRIETLLNNNDIPFKHVVGIKKSIPNIFSDIYFHVYGEYYKGEYA